MAQVGDGPRLHTLGTWRRGAPARPRGIMQTRPLHNLAASGRPHPPNEGSAGGTALQHPETAGGVSGGGLFVSGRGSLRRLLGGPVSLAATPAGVHGVEPHPLSREAAEV